MPDIVRVVVMGDEGVGKSALILRLCFDHFPGTHEATADDSILKTTVVDGQECVLDVIDTAGRQQYGTLIEQWIRQAQVFVLVFDVASRKSFSHIKEYYDQVREIKQAIGDDSTVEPAMYPGPPYYAPLIVVGNKNDLKRERAVKQTEGARLARKLDGEYVETSARNNVNVEEAFNKAVRKLRVRQDENERSWLSKDEGAKKTPKRFRPFHRRHPRSCRCVMF
ncbi:Ras family protein [Aspergillus alliaceus]|uniref:Ras family protein n=1 Tax=Petromyces alliaceus TaxID=209559 RepID=UPI0012A60901|nr:ras family-domain-containing protein [Aspergillus alliaceus]KAB8231220.1 ras family-domain-containing protein [Aspergillus alliaceus]